MLFRIIFPPFALTHFNLSNRILGKCRIAPAFKLLLTDSNVWAMILRINHCQFYVSFFIMNLHNTILSVLTGWENHMTTERTDEKHFPNSNSRIKNEASREGHLCILDWNKTKRMTILYHILDLWLNVGWVMSSQRNTTFHGSAKKEIKHNVKTTSECIQIRRSHSERISVC